MTQPSLHPNRRSVRLRGHDYTSVGVYFVTICTALHKCTFGNVVNGEMRLSSWGKIAQAQWVASGTMRQELELDAFVIMPNHMHGIVWFIHDDVMEQSKREPSSILPDLDGDRLPFERRAKSLGAFVGGYKASVTSRINQIEETNGLKVWQRSYWDHIIRSDDALATIREYVAHNPLNWQIDQLHPEAPPNRWR